MFAYTKPTLFIFDTVTDIPPAFYAPFLLRVFYLGNLVDFLEIKFSVACDPSCLNFVLFDVRPAEEFNRCHLQSTMHLETTDDSTKIVELISNHIQGFFLNLFLNAYSN